MSKDWTGNKNTENALVGYSPNGEREMNDYYATDPKAAVWLMKLEDLDNNIWECACGEGHLAKELLDHGHNVFSSDLVYRGFGVGGWTS